MGEFCGGGGGGAVNSIRQAVTDLSLNWTGLEVSLRP